MCRSPNYLDPRLMLLTAAVAASAYMFSPALMRASGEEHVAQQWKAPVAIGSSENPNLLHAEQTAVASDLFSQAQLPSAGPARVIGYYSQGCLAGATELPLKGPYWQVMGPSRNRNWGHPDLVKFIERLAKLAKVHTGWAGILVGDMAQPRGGPLPSGHASHQIGLDVDIWLRPMPPEPFTRAEADDLPMISVVAPDGKQLDPSTWQPADRSLIKLAAEQPEVERVFVNPAIKKALCQSATPADEDWMRKVRPWYGHDSHMHVRLRCPPGAMECREQDPVPAGDGCVSVDDWFSPPDVLTTLHRLVTPPPVKPPTLIRDLPAACVSVLHARGRTK